MHNYKIECEKEERKFCSNWKSEGILIKKFDDKSTELECYERCKADSKCVSFTLNNQTQKCVLNRAGCNKRKHKTFDFYDMNNCRSVQVLARIGDRETGSGFGGLFEGMDENTFEDYFPDYFIDQRSLFDEFEYSGDSGVGEFEFLDSEGAVQLKNGFTKKSQFKYFWANDLSCGVRRSSAMLRDRAMATYRRVLDKRPSRYTNGFSIQIKKYITHIFDKKNFDECDVIYVDCMVYNGLLGVDVDVTMPDFLLHLTNVVNEINRQCHN